MSKGNNNKKTPILVTPPKRFVGMHSHSGFSTYDGLGYPKDHIDFVVENEMDAWALTDHGNANGHAHARKHYEKLHKQGRKYRQLYGVEFYFVPDLNVWAEQYQQAREEAARIREEKKALKKIKEAGGLDAEVDVSTLLVGEKMEDQGHVVEDEDETRMFDLEKADWKRRYHLVVIAKNERGLKNLYKLVKLSYSLGFYKFPRIDFKWLKEHGQDLIVSSACLGGIASGRVLKGGALKLPDSEIQRELSNLGDRFVDAVGRENFFWEIQFNKLAAQHDVNKHLLLNAKTNDIKLIATADSHYYSPDLWEARELYRRLKWKGKEPKPLPTFDQLKCELYPKNAGQMWNEYLNYRDEFDFYPEYDEVIKDSIERTHDLAWDECTDYWVDTNVKLPSFGTKEKSAMNQLVDLVITALKKEGLDKDPVYIDRVKKELSDIKFLGFENYFLTMNEVFHIAEQKTLFGAARGCFTPDMRVKMSDNLFAPISSIKPGDSVIDAYGEKQKVQDVFEYSVNEEIIELEFDDGRIIRCTKDHEILTKNRNWVRAEDLNENDDISEIS